MGRASAGVQSGAGVGAQVGVPAFVGVSTKAHGLASGEEGVLVLGAGGGKDKKGKGGMSGIKGQSMSSVQRTQ